MKSTGGGSITGLGHTGDVKLWKRWPLCSMEVGVCSLVSFVNLITLYFVRFEAPDEGAVE